MASEWDASTVETGARFKGDAGDGGEGAYGYVTPAQAKIKFEEFFRSYREEEEFIYRDMLTNRVQRGLKSVEINLTALASYQPELKDLIRNAPNDYIPMMEAAAVDVLKADGREEVPAIQCTFRMDEGAAMPIRGLTAQEVNNLVKVSGIVISAARAKPKATKVSIRCEKCNLTKQLPVRSAFGAVALPRKCEGNKPTNPEGGPIAGAQEDCGLDPFVIVPDKCHYVDHQVLKLQEPPDTVPTGEMPRHILLSVDRELVDAVSPGTRVAVLGVSSIFNASAKRGGGRGAGSVRTPYLRVVGIQADEEGAGRAIATFSTEEEEDFKNLAQCEDLFERFSQSIAPSISGADTIEDIKRAITCLLMGGSRKLLPDGMRLRGDVNILLLGDPSTAKSQFLKFVEKVAPVGVYTSGKGSSAAGLTATVLRDAKGEFYLEGGAMVLADGGVVCIDEFDKMREEDRVAIHEAMEQQTISVAKAGITTILNSRAAVLAAANPVFGRYDDMMTAAENIDFLPTILSRFDLIFIVRDVRNAARDMQIARHVIQVHMNAGAAAAAEDGDEGAEINIATMKRYVAYCRSRCAPRLSPEAARMLQQSYVKIRQQQRSRAAAESVIPITVRQLEALVRLSESIAKVTLSPVANEDHVAKALQLFNVSTMNAAAAGLGDAGLSKDVLEEVKKAEDALKKILHIGNTKSTKDVRRALLGSGHSSIAADHALRIMATRQELQFLNERRMVKRLK